MLEGQRLTVHADGEQGVAVVGQGGERRAARPPVGARLEHHVGAGPRPSHREQLAHRPSGPDGIAHEVAADLVGDADQGDERLPHLLVLQGVPVDLDLTLDHAGDLEPPLGGVEARHDDGSVDPVEVVVGHDERASPPSLEVGAGGDGDRRAGRRLRLMASREAVAAAEPPPSRLPTYAAEPPTSAAEQQASRGFDGGANRVRRVPRLRNHSPAATPSSVGNDVGRDAPGRESTAATPTAPRTPKRTRAAVSRRRARTPMTAQTTARTTTMPTSRARLSFVPKVAMAKSLSHAGVRSMKALLTAATGAGWPPGPAERAQEGREQGAEPDGEQPRDEPVRRAHPAGPASRVGAARRGGAAGSSWSWPEELLQVRPSARKARNRCETPFFSPAAYSARVRSAPAGWSAGTKMGS